MNKTQEALKLALEALGYWHVRDKFDKQTSNAITAIREALAEQPAQQQEQEGPINDGWQITVAHGHSGYGVYAHMEDYPEEGAVLVQTIEQPAQLQEPVAYIKTWHKNGEQHADIWQWEVGIEALKDGNHYLYTSPPASKPWVGLTDEEERELAAIASRDAIYSIEAKLKDKNGY